MKEVNSGVSAAGDLGGTTAARDTGLQTRDSIAQALDFLNAANEWKPQPGGRLMGRLEAIVPATGPFGQGHQIVIADDQGNLWRLWLTGYIKASLEGYHAAPGDSVGIQYEGKGVSKAGKTFNRYQVVVHKGGA
jgi:hypothetical protein